MTKLYGVSDNHRVVAEELAEIKQKHEEELLHKDAGYFEMFTAPRMAYRIALGVGLQALQQLTGANYFCETSSKFCLLLHRLTTKPCSLLWDSYLSKYWH